MQIANTVTSVARGGTTFIYILAATVGVVLIIVAIRMIILKGASPNAREILWGAIVSRMLIGTLLVTMGWTLGQVLETTGNPQELQSALAYVQSQTRDEVSSAIWTAIRAWCVLMGTAGFFRGFLLLDRATHGGRDGGDDVWRAFWHILGGALTIQLFS